MMTSAAVNQMVLCFLLAGGQSICPTSGAAIFSGYFDPATYQSDLASVPSQSITAAGSSASVSGVDGSQQQVTPENSKPRGETALNSLFDASDRVEMLAPDHPVTLTEPFEIPVQIHKAGLTGLYSNQTLHLGATPEAAVPVYGSDEKLQISYRQDGSAYVTIIPLALGKIELDIVGGYPDYGIVHKKIELDVQPPQKRPAQLTVSAGSVNSETPHAVLALKNTPGDGASRVGLGVSARYDGIPTSIAINPSFVTFRIINWDSKTIPIQLDSQTGIVTPLYPGQALVETMFGGRRNLTCIDVEQQLTPGRSYFEKNCQQLLSPGEKLGRQE